MKKLLLFSLFLVAFACSKEDEASEQSEQTFLEKYDGVAFERLVKPPVPAAKEINFFYNSYVFLREVNYWADGGCNIAVEGTTPSNTCSTVMWCLEIKIVENKSSNLILRFGDNYGYEYLFFKVDASGEMLTRGGYEMVDGKLVVMEDSIFNATYTKSDAKDSDYCN